MSTEPKQSCGSCKWWKNDGGWSYNDCTAPVPVSLSFFERDTTSQHDGTDCQCFERKDVK